MFFVILLNKFYLKVMHTFQFLAQYFYAIKSKSRHWLQHNKDVSFITIALEPKSQILNV